MNLTKKIIFFLDNKQKKKFILIIPFIIILTVLEATLLAIIIPILNLFLDVNFINNYPYINIIFEKFSLLNNFFFKNDKFLLLINGAIIFFFILVVIKNVIFLIFVKFKSNLLEDIQANIQKKLIFNFFNTPYEVIASRNSSSFLTTERNLGHLISSIENLVITVSELLILSSILLLILYKNLFFGFVVIILFSLFSFFLIFWNKTNLISLGKIRNAHEEHKIGYLLNIFNGIKEIKLFKKENYFFNLYIYHSLLSLDSNKKIFIYNTIPKILLEIFIIFIAVLFIFYLSFLGKDSKIILSSIGFYLVAAMRVVPSVNKILINFQSLKYNKSFIDELYLDQTKNNFSLIKNYKYFSANKSIELKNILFNYPQKKNIVFKGLNLRINKNDKIGIIGGSGLGKTTLINIIIGLLRPSEGKIIIDNQKITKNFILNNCALVTSNIFFTNNTILENIYFGSKNKVNLSRVKEIIEDTQLENFITNLDLGLNTLLSEKGTKISSGQIQRINIARALYANPNILILDEATNALDVKTENIVIDKIFKKYKNMTIIIISHKKNNLRYCDRVYQLKNKSLIKIS
jgi:ATP-binding cassette subfamily C protein